MEFEKLTEYLDSLKTKYGIPATDIKVTRGHETVYRHMTGYTEIGRASCRERVLSVV